MAPIDDEHTGRDAVVVLNYRGRDDTLACVTSLLADPHPPTVLVVDNGSEDGLLRDVRERWPEVRTVAHRTNQGFAGGMNSGVRQALSDGARTVTVLNNDTLVPAGTIEALAERAMLGEAVSPTVRHLGAPDVWFAGGAVDHRTGIAEHVFGHRLADQPVREGVRRTEVLAGCCVTASAATWRRVGLFDERYFLLFEDSDWSLRAAAAGVPLTVLTDVAIEHRVSASAVGATAYLNTYYYTRNGLLFGRERLGARTSSRARLLRRHVLPPISRRMRDRQAAPALRHLVLVVAAVGADAMRRYGAAPAGIRRLAVAWARDEEAGTDGQERRRG